MTNKPLISIILPTRHRVDSVNRLFDSIESTVDEIDRLEIVLYIDYDDFESQVIERSVLNLVKLIGKRTIMGEMTRQCYTASSSQYIFLLNDDAVCRTKGWDTRILRAFDKYPDGVVLVWCNDLFRGPDMPNFPVLSRSLCELMGGICPEDYNRDYIDVHLLDIFKKLHNLGYYRLEYLQDVIIEHLHHEAGKAEIDDTYIKPKLAADELIYISWEYERQIAANSLMKYIQQRALCVS